ncbi:MAG: hypothetical protein ACI96M_004828, partial [Candidatus Azotimanducaceae bacterium]
LATPSPTNSATARVVPEPLKNTIPIVMTFPSYLSNFEYTAIISHRKPA